MPLVIEYFFFFCFQCKSKTTAVSASATLLIKIKLTWYTFNIVVLIEIAHSNINYYAYIFEKKQSSENPSKSNCALHAHLLQWMNVREVSGSSCGIHQCAWESKPRHEPFPFVSLRRGQNRCSRSTFCTFLLNQTQQMKALAVKINQSESEGNKLSHLLRKVSLKWTHEW